MERLESPWLGIEKSRPTDRKPYVLLKHLQRIMDVLLTIAEIAAKREIYDGLPVFYWMR